MDNNVSLVVVMLDKKGRTSVAGRVPAAGPLSSFCQRTLTRLSLARSLRAARSERILCSYTLLLLNPGRGDSQSLPFILSYSWINLSKPFLRMYVSITLSYSDRGRRGGCLRNIAVTQVSSHFLPLYTSRMVIRILLTSLGKDIL